MVPMLARGGHEVFHEGRGEARTYQIGAVAQLVHLSLRTLRYWEEEGLISPTARTAGGFRMYSEADIARVRLVRSMKAADLSIEELRELLAAVEAVSGAAGDEERAAAAERLAAFVRRIRERLEILRGRMAETEEAALWLEALAAGDEIVADNPLEKPLPPDR